MHENGGIKSHTIIEVMKQQHKLWVKTQSNKPTMTKDPRITGLFVVILTFS
jgi:hypothetical protein